ncbi:hypothetical protein [Legionella shakespearei]|nr:hypothetical protein [Legionella shakespearei]
MTLSFLSHIRTLKENLTHLALAIYHSTRYLSEITFLLAYIDKLGLSIRKAQMNLTTNDEVTLTDSRIQKGRLMLHQDNYFSAFKGHAFFCGSAPMGHALKQLCDTDKKEDVILHLESFSN